MSEEQWRPARGFEGRYEVSSLGKVRNVLCRGRSRCRLLRPIVSRGRYLCVTLSDASLKRHRRAIAQLVAEAFVPNPASLRYTTHKDGDVANNAADNIAWMRRNRSARGTEKGIDDAILPEIMAQFDAAIAGAEERLKEARHDYDYQKWKLDTLKTSLREAEKKARSLASAKDAVIRAIGGE